MKKFLLTVAVVILTASGAYAQYATYDAAYMTDPGSTLEKPGQTFNWDEKPSLYLRLLSDILPMSIMNFGADNVLSFGTSTQWISPSGKVYALSDTGGASNQFWLNFTDAFWFSGAGSNPAIREAGTWTIDQIWTVAQVGDNTPTFNHAAITFAVQAVPEPLSASLLILGGVALAFSRRRKS
jgi:hypothetical protein